MAFNNIYTGKKVLITGNTGFKGSWLTTWLLSLGAEVYGYSDRVPTTPSMYEAIGLNTKVKQTFGDIRSLTDFETILHNIRPDFIFHLAAQAIVSTSYSDPMNTITTNVTGTAVVMEAIRSIDWNCTCVIITSDKAYDNVEWIWGYRENDALGGKDVYSGSKGAAELVIKSYWHSFIKHKNNIRIGVARAGNVIGGGDWAQDRIVVDCVKAFSCGDTVEIRSPKATRPWQHVLEPLSGYLTLGQYLTEGTVENGEAFNFGPRAEQTKTVYELVVDLADLWGADSAKSVRITGNVPFHEATLLKLNCDKALAYLNWHSTLNYKQCISYIAGWYKNYYIERWNATKLFNFTKMQILEFTQIAKSQNLIWAND